MPWKPAANLRKGERVNGYEEQQTEPTFNTGFVKMMRTPDILELIAESPLAFTLATMIALRARYMAGVSLKGLHPGEAFLGDYKACGMSEQQYRTAKAQLEKWKFATFRATNKGTIARLIDTRLFDILNSGANGQSNGPPTNDQRLIKKVENGKKGKQEEGCAGAHNGFSGPFEIPSHENVVTYALENDLDADAIESFLGQRSRDGWTIHGQRIRDWKKALRAYCAKFESDRSWEPSDYPKQKGRK